MKQHATTLLLLTLLVSACGKDDGLFLKTNFSGYVIVSTLATAPSTGPGLVTMVGPDGDQISILRDFYNSSEFATGLVYLGSNRLAMSIDGADRIDAYDLLTGVVTPFAVNVNITAAPLRQMATSPDGSVYIVESSTNSIEKVDSNGNRIGAPYLPTTVGACVLATPYGVAVDTDNDQVAVISSAVAGRLSIYNNQAGSCVTHVTAAPFNTGTPVGIAYHSLTGKYIVSFNTTHALYAVDSDGTNATQIYLNSAIINSPRALASDALGNIYVGSDGTDTVEKLYWSGTGVATRALTGPFLGPSIYSQNPTSIVVIP